MNKTDPAVSIDVSLLEDQTDCVYRELELAIRWQRPSILFAIYNSKNVRGVAQNALENRILESGKTVVHYQNNDEEKSSLVEFVSEITYNDNNIFFIDPLTSDNHNNSSDYLYKTLNSSRDQLIDRLIRVVFWLTENEAFNLARNAPDFWASRHRVVDFICQSPLEIPCPTQPAITKKQDIPQKEDDGQSASGINILLTMGVTNWKKGDHDKAVGFLQAALTIAQENADVTHQAICWKAIALVRSDAGKTEDAIQAYNQLIALTSENITVWNNVGALYHKTGNFENAFQAFKNAIKKNSKDPVSWNGLGHVYGSTGRNADAIECYKKAIKCNPKYINPWINLGDVYSGMDQNKLALKTYLRAAEMDANNAHVWFGIGDASFKTNFYQQAIDAYLKAIELGADPDGLSTNLAAAYSHIGDNASAIPQYQKAIEFSATRKEKAALWNKLGDAYRRTAEYENAAAAYKMSDKLSSGNENASPNPPAGKDQAAAEIVGSAPAEPAAPLESVALVPDPNAFPAEQARKPGSDPENAQLWNQLGSAYIKIGALEKALNAYQKAVVLDAANVTTIIHIARLYEQINEPAQALTFHQKSLALLTSDKERANTLSHMSNLYRQMKDFAGALQSLEAAFNLDPTNAAILSGLNKIQEDMDAHLLNCKIQFTSKTISTVSLAGAESQRQPIKALPVASTRPDTSLIDVNLENANVWNELGNIFSKSNLHEDAIDAYNRAIEHDPEFGWSYSNLARVYSIQGKYDQALALYQKSIGLLFSESDKAITWNRIGDVYRQTNQYHEAMQAYQNADRLSFENNRLVNNVSEDTLDQPFTHFVL